jgi:hypothetical protein
MVKIKTFIEVCSEPFIILVQLIHLRLKQTEGTTMSDGDKVKGPKKNIN